MEQFIPLGQKSNAEIIKKLLEIGDTEAANSFQEDKKSLEGIFQPRSWLNTQHQYGFIQRGRGGSKERYYDIQSTSTLKADNSLVNQRVNIRLDYLRVFDYPKTLFTNPEENIHTILFSFEARNQTPEGGETAVFNRTYSAKVRHDVAVQGEPIFIGLSVGANGLSFSCKTVNIGNSSDQEFVKAINSESMEKGLELLTVTQPALVPLAGIARGICNALAEKSKNVAVQQFTLGLDFDSGSLGSRLALGEYIVSQVPKADEINWSDWKYDTQTGTIVKINLAPNESPYALPYNTIGFRVTKYLE